MRSSRAIFTFRRTAQGWEETGLHFSPFNSEHTRFTDSGITLSGEWMFIPDAIAPGQNDPALHGRVHVFRKGVSGAWAFFQTLYGQPGHGFDYFGGTIAVRDGRLYASSGARHTAAPLPRGYTFEFEFDGTQWTQGETLLFADALEPNPVWQTFAGGVVHIPDADWLISRATDYPVPGANHIGRLYSFELPVGERSCIGVPGPLGLPASLAATGSRTAGLGSLDFTSTFLPPNALALLLTAPNPGAVMGPGGSQGLLCLGAGIQRLGASMARASALGEWSYVGLPLGGVTTPTPLPALAGETWHFQLWYRQPGPSSNFSDALAIPFR